MESNVCEAVSSQCHNIMSDPPLLGTYTHPDIILTTSRRSRLLGTTYFFVRMQCVCALAKERGFISPWIHSSDNIVSLHRLARSCDPMHHAMGLFVTSSRLTLSCLEGIFGCLMLLKCWPLLLTRRHYVLLSIDQHCLIEIYIQHASIGEFRWSINGDDTSLGLVDAVTDSTTNIQIRLRKIRLRKGQGLYWQLSSGYMLGECVQLHKFLGLMWSPCLISPRWQIVHHNWITNHEEALMPYGATQEKSFVWSGFTWYLHSNATSLI